MPDELRPPPEFAGMRWHWIVIQPFMPVPAYWSDHQSVWRTVDGLYSTADAHKKGLSYLKPCDPTAITIDPADEGQRTIVATALSAPLDTSVDDCMGLAVGVLAALKEMG